MLFLRISLQPQKLIPYYTTEYYNNLVDPWNLVLEIHCGEITLKIFSLKNYPLCGIYVNSTNYNITYVHTVHNVISYRVQILSFKSISLHTIAAAYRVIDRIWIVVMANSVYITRLSYNMSCNVSRKSHVYSIIFQNSVALQIASYSAIVTQLEYSRWLYTWMELLFSI